MIEDLINNFIFDYGCIQIYCMVIGFGICLDGGIVYFGVVIICYYDSLLIKVIVCVQMFEMVIVCMDCVLCEFCICGVSINIDFVINLLKYLMFLLNEYIIKFIDMIEDLFNFKQCCDCVIKILIYIVDIIVNGYLEIVGCLKFYVEVKVLKVFVLFGVGIVL